MGNPLTKQKEILNLGCTHNYLLEIAPLWPHRDLYMQGLSNQIVECLLLRAIVVERQPKGVFLTKKMGLVGVVLIVEVDSILVE